MRVKNDQHLENLRNRFIENFEEGLALFSLDGIDRASKHKKNPKFLLEWSNETFDIHFQC